MVGPVATRRRSTSRTGLDRPDGFGPRRPDGPDGFVGYGLKMIETDPPDRSAWTVLTLENPRQRSPLVEEQ